MKRSYIENPEEALEMVRKIAAAATEEEYLASKKELEAR